MIDGFINIAQGQIQNYSAFQSKVAGLNEGRYYFTIEKKNKRTNNQNAYIHAVLFPELAKALVEVGYEGITAEMAKEIAKRRFLTVQIPNPETGEVMEYVKETSKLTTTEMNEFIESVIRFAAESLSYQIPYPNEQIKFDYE